MILKIILTVFININIHLLLLRTLTSSLKLSSTETPAHTLSKFSNIDLYLGKALITFIPSSVLGLFRRYPNHERTVSNFLNSPSSLPSTTLKSILSKSSVKRNRSIIIGAAKSESSHTLYSTRVCYPPIKIDERYSSIAFFESPVYGTYLITI